MSEVGEKLIAGIRQAALERPDHVNESTCQYFDWVNPDDSTSGFKGCCIVGVALEKTDIYDPQELEHFPSWNGEKFEAVYGFLDEVQYLDREEIEWINAVQMLQDRDLPWALAVAYVDVFKDQLEMFDYPQAKSIAENWHPQHGRDKRTIEAFHVQVSQLQAEIRRLRGDYAD